MGMCYSNYCSPTLANYALLSACRDIYTEAPKSMSWLGSGCFLNSAFWWRMGAMHKQVS